METYYSSTENSATLIWPTFSILGTFFEIFLGLIRPILAESGHLHFYIVDFLSVSSTKMSLVCYFKKRIHIFCTVQKVAIHSTRF